jgi:hypothetical protein
MKGGIWGLDEEGRSLGSGMGVMNGIWRPKISSTKFTESTSDSWVRELNTMIPKTGKIRHW